MALELTNEPARNRYEARLDGELAGFSQYRERPGLIAFIHTEIDPAQEGQGIGGKLVAHALDDARQRGLAVLPFCPFVNGYIERHPEYVDLIPAEHRAKFGF